MDKNREFKILSPTAILGYGFPEESFRNGIKHKPDLIAVDAGSTDPGPYYLGSGKPFTNRVGVKRDLRIMLREGVKRNIPVIIGTAGGSGASPHLMWCKKIIEEIAHEEGLSFNLGTISADIPKEKIKDALKKRKIQSLYGVPTLTQNDIDESTFVVAQMGVEPIIKALKNNCDIILCGRCYDPAVFAALPIHLGYDTALALHLGKILECAAIAATPGSGADSVLGTLKEDSFILTPLSKERKFTKESVAAHTLYEKSDPYNLPGPGGSINLENCSFKELTGGRVEVRGSQFIKSNEYMIKLEGAKKVGYRTISIAGSRDPIMIKGIESIIKKVDDQVKNLLKQDNINGKVIYHIYGKDAVMGNMEPQKTITSHEIGIIIEAVAKTETEADTICSITRSTLLHYGYPGRISTAGNLAFLFSPSDMKAGPVFEFSMYHLMEIKDGSLFKLKKQAIKQ